MISSLLFIFFGGLSVLSESTWLHLFACNGIMPGLTMILVISSGILLGSRRGRVVGLCCGLLQDILFCRVIGFYGALFYLCGHVSGLLNKNLSHALLVLPLSLVIILELAAGLLQYIIFDFFSGDLHLGYALIHSILPETVYTAILMIPLYFLWNGVASFGSHLDESFSSYFSNRRNSL